MSNLSESYALAVLAGLQGKHVYGGSVPAAVAKRRRTKNKVTRRARRINRQRGAR